MVGTNYHDHRILDAFDGSANAFLTGRSSSPGQVTPIISTSKSVQRIFSARWSLRYGFQWKPAKCASVGPAAGTGTKQDTAHPRAVSPAEDALLSLSVTRDTTWSPIPTRTLSSGFRKTRQDCQANSRTGIRTIVRPRIHFMARVCGMYGVCIDLNVSKVGREREGQW